MDAPTSTTSRRKPRHRDQGPADVALGAGASGRSSSSVNRSLHETRGSNASHRCARLQQPLRPSAGRRAAGKPSASPTLPATTLSVRRLRGRRQESASRWKSGTATSQTPDRRRQGGGGTRSRQAQHRTAPGSIKRESLGTRRSNRTSAMCFRKVEARVPPNADPSWTASRLRAPDHRHILPSPADGVPGRRASAGRLANHLALGRLQAVTGSTCMRNEHRARGSVRHDDRLPPAPARFPWAGRGVPATYGRFG